VNMIQNGAVTTSLVQNINVETDPSPPALAPIASTPSGGGGSGGVLAASCIDDRSVPHPASQVQPGRAVPASYQGEVYRCIAGTTPQATINDQVLACSKGDAIFRTAE